MPPTVVTVGGIIVLFFERADDRDVK
jgi:hypothetical protein